MKNCVNYYLVTKEETWSRSANSRLPFDVREISILNYEIS